MGNILGMARTDATSVEIMVRSNTSVSFFVSGKVSCRRLLFGNNPGPAAGALLPMHLTKVVPDHAHEVIKVSCVVGSLCECPSQNCILERFTSLCILGGFLLLFLRKLSSP